MVMTEKYRKLIWDHGISTCMTGKSNDVLEIMGCKSYNVLDNGVHLFDVTLITK